MSSLLGRFRAGKLGFSVLLLMLTLLVASCGGGGGGGGGGSALTVSASPAGGGYSTAQSVTLTASETATIYYTTDGSTPTTSSTVYSSAIAISSTTTLKFYAVDGDGNSSSVVTETYLFSSSVQLSGVSLQDVSSSLTAITTTSAGGTLSINDASSPLNGLSIVVPEGATDEDITFAVSYSDVTSVSGLPGGSNLRGKVVRIQADGSDTWDTYGMFDKAVKVTLPYDNSSDDIVGYYAINEDGSLEPMGLEGIDTTNGTITFWTRTFANAADETTTIATTAVPRNGVELAPRAVSVRYATYVAVGIAAQTWADWTNNGKVINTGFTAANNGWYIPNYGSFYKKSRGGNCMGMVGWAKYYFKAGYSPKLYGNYHDADNTTTWVDDATAIQLASRVHNGMADIWNQFLSGELNEQTQSSLSVARSLVGALYVTGSPALLYIQQSLNVGGTIQNSGAHAIMTYRADIDASGNITFYIYDPNHPNKDDRRITYTNGVGFASYASGTTAANSSFSYNYFKHFGYNVGMSDAALAALKTSADANFSDDTKFPTITITSITGKTKTSEDVLNNTGTTDEGQDKYITSDTAVVIEGTVLGGLSQTAGSVVNNLNVLTPSGNYTTPINNQAGAGDGKFTVTVPLLQGENMVALLASANNSYSHWAAFDLNIIESTASSSAITVTLAWGQNQSDVDLYVKEPDGDGGKVGDTVYFSNDRFAGGGNPYLDFDNTSGYGPEHYIGTSGDVTKYTDFSEATSLYGDYTVKVHYYADHDDDSQNTQPISWIVDWRYLAFCADPCTDPETDGIWFEGSQSGQLSAASSSNCCDITHTGGDWSSSFPISYPEPSPDDYTVPDPPDVMLP